MATAREDDDPTALATRMRPLFAANDWEQLCQCAEALPVAFDAEWSEVAQQAAFALGQLSHRAAATAIFERCWAVRPSYQVASALAYQFYAASLDLTSKRPAPRDAKRRRRHRPGNPDTVVSSKQRRDRSTTLELVKRFEGPPGWLERDRLREGFRTWIAEALKRAPVRTKDLYRLGIFEAQVESARDKHALRAFLAAIASYEELDATARGRRQDLHKYYVRAFYAGGRSALRLKKPQLARKLSFQCLREDPAGRSVEAVFQLGLAGRCCLAVAELDHAERAFRKALAAKGPPRRDYLYGYLAEVSQQRGDLEAAEAWITRHTPPQRRSAALWRQLGDIQGKGERWQEAEQSYRNALERDRGGKHLTYVRLGDVLLAQGRVRPAERAFTKALDFRRRRYSSTDTAAQARLTELRQRRQLEAKATTPGPDSSSGPGLARCAAADDKELTA